jgi:NCS2 family nucleobase:cation symporter-2
MVFLGDTARILLTSGLLPAAFIAIGLNLILPEHFGDEADDEVSGAVKGIKENSRKA